jgi:hypothetical protein
LADDKMAISYDSFARKFWLLLMLTFERISVMGNVEPIGGGWFGL